MPATDMEIEKVGNGTLAHAVQHIAHSSTGDQAETNRLPWPCCSHGPDEKSGHDQHLDSSEHKWAIEEDFAEHAEADARVETQRQVEKWRDYDRARRHHHNIEDQPFRYKIGRKRSRKGAAG